MIQIGIDRRQVLRGAALASAGVALPLGAAPARADRGSAADLVLFGGQVLTLDRGFRVAGAVAVRDGLYDGEGGIDHCGRRVAYYSAHQSARAAVALAAGVARDARPEHMCVNC